VETYPAELGPLPLALSGDRLFADVAAFDTIGVHRTATAEDRATTLWLENHLKAHGYRARRQAFTVRQFYPETRQIDVGGTVIPVHPQWPVASAITLSAPIARVENAPTSATWIALLDFPFEQRASMASERYATLLDGAARAGAAAAIAITQGPTGEIIVLNAPGNHTPLPLPTVLVAPERALILGRSAAQNATIQLTVTGQIEAAAPAENLTGIIDRGTPWIVISTPQSAWSHGAGERGPGIALWRALAEVLAATSKCSLMFVATSGHELGHAGAEKLLPEITPLIRENGLACWLHLGANIAVRDYAKTDAGYRLLATPAHSRYLTASPSLLASLTWCFAGEPGLTPLPAIGGKLAGETATILAHGFSPVVGLFGSSLFHHTQLDRAANATNPQILTSVGRRIFRFIRSVDLEAG
jgi:hypothetical protein